MKAVKTVPLTLGEARRMLDGTRIAARSEMITTGRGDHESFLRRVVARADEKRRKLGLVVVDGIWCRRLA